MEALKSQPEAVQAPVSHRQQHTRRQERGGSYKSVVELPSPLCMFLGSSSPARACPHGVLCRLPGTACSPRRRRHCLCFPLPGWSNQAPACIRACAEKREEGISAPPAPPVNAANLLCAEQPQALHDGHVLLGALASGRSVLPAGRALLGAR